jgi:phosphate/sulfate permease
MTWTALPSGQDFPVQAGQLYAAIASVKNSHTQADITQLAQQHWGLELLLWGEQGQPNWPNLPTDPDSGKKTVYGVVRGTRSDTVPWSVPTLLQAFDNSNFIAVWTSSDPNDVNVAPTAWAQQANPPSAGTTATTTSGGGETAPGALPGPAPTPVNVPSVPAVAYVAAGAAVGLGLFLLWPRIARVLGVAAA